MINNKKPISSSFQLDLYSIGVYCLLLNTLLYICSLSIRYIIVKSRFYSNGDLTMI